MSYVKVVFDDDYGDSYLQDVVDLVLDEYSNGGFDGFKPTVTIEDEEKE
jgi:hypothetical protein